MKRIWKKAKDILLSIVFIVVDLFCGAGGTTTGFEMAEINGQKVCLVIACVNHDKNAIESHAANHPHTKHFFEDIRTLPMEALAAHVMEMRKLYPNAKLILHASLECTNFSKAKGGQPRDADSRTLADHLDRYVIALSPDYITIENVVEFMSWGPLDENGKPISTKNGIDWQRWKDRINSYGYRDEWKELNSANYGAYTSRNRLFGIFARPELPIVWPEATHAKNKGKGKPTGDLFTEVKELQHWKPVREVLNLNDKGESIFTRKKALSPKTLERIYAGLIKFVAGGKEKHAQYIVKFNGTDKKTGKVHSGVGLDESCPVVSTQNRLYLAQPQFISKYYSGKPEHKNISIEGPAGTIKTIDGQAIVSAEFITQRNGGDPESKIVDIEGPARTVTGTGGNQDLVSAEFLQSYNGNGAAHSLDDPCATIATHDRFAKVSPQFIMANYSNGDNTRSLESVCGTVVTNPKENLVSTKFLTTTNFAGVQQDLDRPSPTITADRHHHYLMNPQFANSLSTTDKPCFTIIARMDKRPPYLVETVEGHIAIEIYPTDCEMTVKIKQFMAAYGIVDILMRMLRILELLKIQGFISPDGTADDYKLQGTQADQKKQIGNAVVPVVPQRMAEALAIELTTLLMAA